MVYSIFVSSCILLGFIIFWKSPALPSSFDNPSRKRISVIIPARNEERNLGHLLEDLRLQKSDVFEVICVDDDSDDGTAQVAKSFDVTLISLRDRPDGWTGKSWACQVGADNATGELLLFLDADVRLDPMAVRKLEYAYAQSNCTVSVQPYHQVERYYEQLSLFFNLIQVGGNGVGAPRINGRVALFGPVILMGKQEYVSIEGHMSVKGSIIEDVELGEVIAKNGMKYCLFLGGSDIRFRMYEGGLVQLVEGWTKNFASGAAKARSPLLLMNVLWISSCISVPAGLASSVAYLSPTHMAVYSSLYAVIVLQLWMVSRRIGSFKKSALILYPIPLMAFLGLFAVSVFKKLFIRKAKWKGRNIDLRR